MAGKRKWEEDHVKTFLREAKAAEARGDESLPADASDALELITEGIVKELEIEMIAKKRKISDDQCAHFFVVGKQVRFDDREIYTIEKVHPRGLGKGGNASYTLKGIGGRMHHMNVVMQSTKTGEYIFSNEDCLFREGEKVHLNPFVPMRVYEIRDDSIAFTRNNGVSWISFSKQFAKDVIIAVDEKRNNNPFWEVWNNTESKWGDWEVKKEFLQERKQYSFDKEDAAKARTVLTKYFSFDKEAYADYLKRKGLKNELIRFYTRLHSGCHCCWGA